MSLKDAKRCAVRLRARSFDVQGQGTVEFALVTAAFLAVAITLGALWRALGDGAFVEHALVSASHQVSVAALGAVADVFLY